MIRWARLTWQSATPAELAADLGRRLGLDVGTHGSLDGAYVAPLGDADLELVPWQRESAADDPQPGGRLVFEPIEGGMPAAPRADAPLLFLAAVGWATVELDRAEAELAAWLAPAAASPAGLHHDGELMDPHLGARTRLRVARGLPGEALVLAEPATEGRLAASLARDGEGPCALYLRPREGLDRWRDRASARRVTLSAVHAGPLGRSVLVPGASRSGPHVIVVEADGPRPAGVATGTIGP